MNNNYLPWPIHEETATPSSHLGTGLTRPVSARGCGVSAGARGLRVTHSTGGGRVGDHGDASDHSGTSLTHSSSSLWC